MYNTFAGTKCPLDLLTCLLDGDLAAGGFSVQYQPIVRLSDRCVVAVEALARWRHPVFGDVDPSYFVSLAEAQGLVDVIDQFVMRRACVDRVELESMHGADVVIHLNVSASRLGHNLLESALEEALQRSVPAERLVLEITETSPLLNLSSALEAVQRIRARGIRIALDDFGTGFSRMERLDDLPVDILKLDSAITHVEMDPMLMEPMCEAMFALGRKSGLRIVAEGVESETQAVSLARIGCELGQGFHLGSPQTLSGSGHPQPLLPVLNVAV